MTPDERPPGGPVSTGGAAVSGVVVVCENCTLIGGLWRGIKKDVRYTANLNLPEGNKTIMGILPTNPRLYSAADTDRIIAAQPGSVVSGFTLNTRLVLDFKEEYDTEACPPGGPQ